MGLMEPTQVPTAGIRRSDNHPEMAITGRCTQRALAQAVRSALRATNAYLGRNPGQPTPIAIRWRACLLGATVQDVHFDGILSGSSSGLERCLRLTSVRLSISTVI